MLATFMLLRTYCTSKLSSQEEEDLEEERSEDGERPVIQGFVFFICHALPSLNPSLPPPLTPLLP